MSGWLLILAGLLPWGLIPLALRPTGGRWLWLAPLPALLVTLLPSTTMLSLPWLLLGTRLELDPQTAPLLLVAALLWWVAGYYAERWQRGEVGAERFRVCFLLAMGGNFGVILSADLVSFYLSFSVMGLAAYGLVVHGGGAAQRRAGRVYLAMTLLGEMALFAAFVMIYQRTGTLMPAASQLMGASPWEIGWLMLAFGIKAGMAGLHFWLPLAHPAAPVPASAVLSGAMIKTALIGWLNFLPLGTQALPGWGLIMIGAGALASLLAVVIGLVQRDAKVVLAYSSISKMGLMIMVLGLALSEPRAAPVLLAAMVLFAVHHGLAKGALFLGVGLVKTTASPRAWCALLVPALVLAGAPLTSGALAKTELTRLLELLGPDGSVMLATLLLLSGFTTPLLMARFLWLLRQLKTTEGVPHQQWLPWLGLVLLLLTLPWLLGPLDDTWVSPLALLLALLLAGLVERFRPARLVSQVGRIPAGDLLQWLVKAADWLAEQARRSHTRLAGEAWALRSSPGWRAVGTMLTKVRHLHPGNRTQAETGLGVRWLVVICLLLIFAV